MQEAQTGVGPPEHGEIVVVLTLSFKPGTVDRVLAAVVPSIEPTRREPGCSRFDVFRVGASPDTLVILERWMNREALQAHWRMPYTQDVLALFEEHLAEPLTDGRNVLYLSDVSDDDAKTYQQQQGGDV